MTLPLILCIVFFLLGAIHLNWAFGGMYGFEASLPTKKNGEKVLNPGKIDSAIVAIGLLGFGAFYLFESGILDVHFPKWLLNLCAWGIPVIFLLRSMGDFKYVGFFKTIKTTDFAQLDTRYFTPLCLGIGVLGIIIQLLK